MVGCRTLLSCRRAAFGVSRLPKKLLLACPSRTSWPLATGSTRAWVRARPRRGTAPLDFAAFGHKTRWQEVQHGAMQAQLETDLTQADDLLASGAAEVINPDLPQQDDATLTSSLIAWLERAGLAQGTGGMPNRLPWCTGDNTVPETCGWAVCPAVPTRPS